MKAEKNMAKITKKDEQKITSLLEDGKDLEAEDLFLAKYILAPARKLQEFVKSVIGKVEGKILSKSEMDNLTLTVSNTISEYRSTMNSLFSQYASLYSKIIYKTTGITSPLVKSTIKNATLDNFKIAIDGALSQTNTQLLSSIRKYQFDLITARQKIDRAVEVGEILKKDVIGAYNDAVKNVNKINPALAKIKQGNFVVYRDGSLHSLESYSEMATRTTILNVERTSVEVKSAAVGRRVVEFYLRDRRRVKSERSVCKSILGTTIKGISMLALDSGAAEVLGIRTLQQAKTEDGKSFGPNCRHSIRPLPDEIYNEIEKLLFVAESEVA